MGAAITGTGTAKGSRAKRHQRNTGRNATRWNYAKGQKAADLLTAFSEGFKVHLAEARNDKQHNDGANDRHQEPGGVKGLPFGGP